MCLFRNFKFFKDLKKFREFFFTQRVATLIVTVSNLINKLQIPCFLLYSGFLYTQNTMFTQDNSVKQLEVY